MNQMDVVLEFEIPKKFETILSLLSKHYGQKNKYLLQKLIVNSKYYVRENYSTDYPSSSWGNDSPQYGHAIHFLAPQVIHTEILSDIRNIGEILRNDLNQIVSASSLSENEYIARVYFDLPQEQELLNWRNESGLLFQNSSLVPVKDEAELERIWDKGFFKVFLSHKSENKKLANQLKTKLAYYGISCFVAHEDIEPTKEWQNEIEKALSTADALVLLLIKGFKESDWTGQEIGVAIGRGVAIFPIRFDLDPYGFIGKYQAISSGILPNNYQENEVNDLALNIFKLMFEHAVTKERILDGLITRVETSGSFEQTNKLMQYISNLEKLPLPLIERLEQAYQNNAQVNGAYNAEQKLPELIKKWRNIAKRNSG